MKYFGDAFEGKISVISDSLETENAEKIIPS